MKGFHCSPRRVRGALLGVTTAGAVFAVGLGGTALAAHGSHHGNGHHGTSNQGVLFVSPAGHAGGADRSCKSAAYSTIQAAVTAAPSGGTVNVCPGTYHEDVVITRSVKLHGLRGATVHGVPSNSTMCDQLGPNGPGSAECLAAITIKSSRVRITGLTVTGAQGEGILATGSLKGGSIGHITIRNNHVTGNDLGGLSPSTTYPECQEVGQVPGDCGEGIHLMGAYDSVVRGNLVNGNSGGILLTDEFGPTDHNLIKGNVVKNNLYDCGVTAPGHNPFALNPAGQRQPKVAGVFDNTIANNRITGNGTKGEGAGVLFANAAPGSASYNNLVIHNYISGNELSGVTLHAHPIPPGTHEDLNGNRITGNTIGRNNTGGDPDAGVTKTTGILVYGAVPVHITITHNKISHDDYGIWKGTGGNVHAVIRHNRFLHVGTPVFTQT